MDDTTSGQPQEQAATGPATPPAPDGAPARRLTRRTDRRVLGGVASGLAAYFAIDPIIVRLGFVAFGFVTGLLAVLLYVVAWAIVPPDTDPYRQQRGGMPAWAWIVLAVCGLLLLPAVGFMVFGPGFDGREFGNGFDFDGPPLWRPGLFWALILVGLGVLLFQRSQRATASGLEEGGDAAAPLSSSTPPRPTRPPSILGRLVVAAGLLVAGLAAVLDNLGILDLDARRLLALLLLVVGIGLLIGAWWGSARWLIAIGVALIPGLLTTSLFSFVTPGRSLHGGFMFGDRTLQPTTPAEIARPIELGVGDLTLDLTALPLTDDPTAVTVTVRAGQIVALVPDNAAVDLRARVGTGEFDIFDEQRYGRGLTFTDTHPGAAGGGRLALDLEVGRGEIVVREQAPEAPPQALLSLNLERR